MHWNWKKVTDECLWVLCTYFYVSFAFIRALADEWGHSFVGWTYEWVTNKSLLRFPRSLLYIFQIFFVFILYAGRRTEGFICGLDFKLCLAQEKKMMWRCSVLQRVCSVSQRVVASCSLLQCVAVWSGGGDGAVLKCAVVCCSQCVALCCSVPCAGEEDRAVWQRVAACCSVLQCDQEEEMEWCWDVL